MTPASWYHCSVKTVGRSAGRSVVAAAAYRLGDRLHEAETDQTHDYRRRSGVTAKFTCAPGEAPTWVHDPEQLWNAANAAEKRRNSTLAREIELALPAAVSPEARAGIVRAMAQELVHRYGVVVSAAIHAPGREGDQRNHHAHILFTTRAIGPEGLGVKTRILDDRKTGPQEVTYLRGYACDLINVALEDAGSDERVDHRSFATRGIEREPTEHLGPTATAMERRDERTERGDLHRDETAHNHQLDGLVAELAEINAAIAAEQERRLDEHYGPAEEAREVPAVLEPVQLEERQSIERQARAEIGVDIVTGNRRWDELVQEPSPASPAPLDDFAFVHRETVALAQPPDPGLSMFLPEPPRGAEPGFAAVHNHTIMQATADAAVIQMEETRAAGGRFARIRAWWNNLREYVMGRREQPQEHVEPYMDMGQWAHQPDRDEIEP